MSRILSQHRVLLGYVARRVGILVPTLLVLSAIAFGFTHALPGDPAATMLGANATPEAVERLRASLGLDTPLPQQYLTYLGNLVQFDLGTSIVTKHPVASELATRFPATAELALLAIVIGASSGFALGLMSARRVGTIWDAAGMASTVIGVSLPVFVLGLGLQYLFAVHLGWLPAIGRVGRGYEVPAHTNFLLIDTIIAGRPDAFGDAFLHLLLPALTLSVVPMAVVARMARASYLKEVGGDHVRVAKAAGLSARKVEASHIIFNALPPVVTVVGLQTGALLSGALIVESIFGWGGIGNLIVQAITYRDYVVIQSGLLFLATVVVLVNLVVDLLHAALDPRVRAA